MVDIGRDGKRCGLIRRDLCAAPALHPPATTMRTIFIVIALLTPLVVFASSSVNSTSASSVPSEASQGPRLRLGVGVNVGGALGAPRGEASDYGAGPGVFARLGVQLNDLIGIDGEASVGSLIFSGYARTAILVSFTPADWFTVSTGPAFGHFYGAGSKEYVGATGRIDFHVLKGRTSTGTRHALAIGVGGDLGLVASARTGAAGAAFINAGYSRY